MRRRLFSIVAALSLLLCVAVCVLWMRSGREERVEVHYNRWLPSDEVYRSCFRAASYSNTLSLRLNHYYHEPGYVRACTAEERLRWQQKDPPGLSWRIFSQADLSGNVASQPPGFGAYHHNFSIPGARYRYDDWVVAFRPWLPMALLLVMPALWLHRFRRARRARLLGLCPTCGYDLRASPGALPGVRNGHSTRGVMSAHPPSRVGSVRSARRCR